MAQTTMGGILVETGQEFRATGRMSSVRNASENLGIVVAGLVGGWVAAHLLGVAFVINARGRVGRIRRSTGKMRQKNKADDRQQ